MIIDFQGRTWEFDLEAITLKQAVAIQLTYGFNLDGWYKALEDTDPRALQCLWWLMLQQAGDFMPITEADCPIMALAEAMSAAMGPDAEKDAEPEPEVPTRPAGPPLSAPGSPTDTTPPPREEPEVAAPVTA